MTLAAALGHLFPLTGTALVGLGLFGFISLRHPLRQLLAVNVMSAGIFLILGGLGREGGVTDPYPQALVITGIVVSVALTAMGTAMILRLAEDRRARASAPPETGDRRS